MLMLMGASIYIWQSGYFSSQADVIDQPEAVSRPTITIGLDKQNLMVGEEGQLSLNGNFSQVPVTQGILVLSFPKDLISVTEISTAGGVLDEAKIAQNDSADGRVILNFLPKSGVAKDGNIATLRIKALQPSNVLFKLETGTDYITGQHTAFTTLQAVDVAPKTSQANLIIR